jgi:PRTRC genetic system protein E
MTSKKAARRTPASPNWQPKKTKPATQFTGGKQRPSQPEGENPMFQELHQFTSQGKCKVLLCISAEGNNVVATVTPLPTESGAAAALSQPLRLQGTPQELDEQFLSILAQYATKRLSLQESLANAAAIMEAAGVQASKQAVSAVNKSASKPPVAAASGSNASATASSGAAAATAPTPVAQSASSDFEVALF